uniref:SH3 domain-containing protein n=1 Tax=Globodera rostochiensis TaxID=31243 RepID=A0A914HVC9_GLORO
MSKILTKSTKITEQTVPKKSAKFVVQRTQSSNTLSLLKAARVAPKACPNSIQQIHQRVSKHHQNSPVAKEQLNIIYMKMLHQRKVAVIDAGGDEQQKAEAILTKEAQQQQKKQTVNNEDKSDIKMAKKGHKNALAAKKWTSALRVVSAMTRFKNVPTKLHEYDVGSRGSSFSTSNESTPSRTYAAEQPAAERKSVDPVYLALKQATAKYGSAVGCCSGGESRRGSQSLTPTGTLFDATMLSARNLSQTSLYDSGTYSENELLSARSGSTPQLHGIFVHSAASRRETSLGLLAALKGTSSSAAAAAAAAEASNSRALTKNERRPKLSAQMKSVSLDCAEILPSSPPVKAKNGEIRHNYYVNKPPLRPAQAFVNGGEAPIIPAGEFEAENQRNNSPSAAFRCAAVPPVGLRRQRRLPPVPVQQPQMPTTDASSTKGVHVQPQVLHIVTHEYVSSDCSLRPCDRLVVVDNGDPDWKHGFKLNDQMEHLITFPNSCVASYKPEEQPMRLLQSCNLSGQKLRLYRDQVVFAQPDSLSNDGKVLVRTEYDKFAKCPLQFLTMA